MQPFIGRKAQLERLRSFSTDPSKSRLTAIYGRRRIGKTRLVKEAYKDLPMLCFEGLEGEGSAEQRKHFLKILHRITGVHAHRLIATSDWEDLLILLAEGIDRPCVIFFDEFQWMAAGRSELVSKLKYVWENYLIQKPVHLILCGSISSFLVKKVVRSKALYGRIDDIIDLGPLSLPEVKRGFFSQRSLLEALEGYLAFGGIPKYLELLDPRKSVRLNFAELCFSPYGYFLTEFDRLFISHFGKARHYRTIVEFLSGRGFSTRRELGKKLGRSSGGRLSSILEELEMAGFIEAYNPLHSQGSTHLKRFRISDPYLRFYFRFVQPIKKRIKKSSEGLALHQALPDKRYDVFRGLAFEQLCYQHAALIARRLGFSALSYDYGAWFRRDDMQSGAQIDLLFRRADRVLTLCEIKFRDHVGKEIIPDVEKKVEVLRRHERYSIEKVLITAKPPTQELLNEGYFSTVLTAEALFSGTGDLPT